MMFVSLPAPASAIPALQLYIEGSVYDSSDESWTFTGDNFRLWVIGNVGQVGTISDVKLTAAFAEGLTGNISITPATATTGLLPAPGDPSLPATPTLVGSPFSASSPSGACVASSTTADRIPCMGDGSTLPEHGEFGDGVEWREFALGNLSLTDSPIGDYIGTPPTTFPSTGQINAYDISVSGFPAGTFIHFDAFDHIITNGRKAKSKFAPFSHDVHDTPDVPEPSTVLLLGLGFVGLAIAVRFRRRHRRR